MAWLIAEPEHETLDWPSFLERLAFSKAIATRMNGGTSNKNAMRIAT